MLAVQAAGTHCALSESCVGTATRGGSCDLGPLSLWLGFTKFCREFATRSEIAGKLEVDWTKANLLVLIRRVPIWIASGWPTTR